MVGEIMREGGVEVGGGVGTEVGEGEEEGEGGGAGEGEEAEGGEGRGVGGVEGGGGGLGEGRGGGGAEVVGSNDEASRRQCSPERARMCRVCEASLSVLMNLNLRGGGYMQTVLVSIKVSPSLEEIPSTGLSRS